MKRLVSQYDEKIYVYMYKVINALGGRNLNFNWLITDIEAYPNDKEINDKLDNEYLFLSNDELLDMLEKEDFQWVWATFSAIPKNFSKKDVLQYQLPDRDNGSFAYDEKLVIQHQLAEIEIDCVDSSYFQVIARRDEYLNDFKECFDGAMESYKSPIDLFTKYDDIYDKPCFEFSFYKFNHKSIKRNLLITFNKWDLVEEDIRKDDSLYIYYVHFDKFIKWYPFFDKPQNKDIFDYFGMDNYYSKEQAKEILDKIKKHNKDENKLIIKFLEKASSQYDGFYIHGI